VPLVHAGVQGFRAQIMTVLPGATACYRCVFEETRRAGGGPRRARRRASRADRGPGGRARAPRRRCASSRERGREPTRPDARHRHVGRTAPERADRPPATLSQL
jgi:molybdopterin/thiamine biosynthesis adenylyltransferase